MKYSRPFISRICILLGLAFGVQWNGFGQSKPDSLSLQLNQVVVTGTRFERSQNKVTSSISVIQRKDLEQGGHINVLPILERHVPGFFLNNRSLAGFGVGPNSGGNISLRGISGSPNNRVLVLIDGQPQYMGIFAHPIADAYHASDVERVEVVRGASSVLYGSNAMGGAINIITREVHRDGTYGNIALNYGSFGTATATGNLGYRKDKFHSMIAVNRSQTNGFRQDAEDGFDNTAAYIKMGYDLNDIFAVSADFQLADAVYFQPGTTEAPLMEDKREFLRGRAALSFRNQGEKVSGSVLFYHNFGDHQFATGFESTDHNQGITAYQNIHLIPGQVITVGLDYNNFGGEAFNENLPPPARKGLGTPHSVSQTDVYLHVQQSVFSKLNLNVGIREVNNSQFGNYTIPAFGLSYQAGQHTTFKGSSSKAFRSPSIVDLYLFPPSNEELEPELMWNHELSWIQQTENQKWRVEFTVFYAKGDNLIQINPMETPSRANNTGAFRNMGLESQVKFRPGSNFNLMVNYSYVDVSENVLFAPQHHLNGQANWDWGKISLLPSLQQIYGLRTSLNTDESFESYTLVNLRVKYQLAPSLYCHADANNLLDTSYQIERGYPMPGINVLGGLNFNF
ncbi:MAG: TonB-dependent receptor [Cyclobacteriaceae bacterium]